MISYSTIRIQDGQIYEKSKDHEFRKVTSVNHAYDLIKAVAPTGFRIFLELKNIQFRITDGRSSNEAELKAYVIVEGNEYELNSIKDKPEYFCTEDFWIPLSKSSSEDALQLFSVVDISDLGLLDIGQAMFVSIQGRKLIPKIEVLWDESRIEKPPTLKPLQILTASPYEYQQHGYEWLVWLRKMGLGGLLGDEMGLGKTLQLIMVLVSEINSGRKPNLVICPPSLLENWRRELLKFANISPHIHQGKERNFNQGFLANQEVVLISYDSLRTDHHYLDQIDWNLIGVDEAQYIKNPTSKRTLAVKSLKKKCGIAITGTPIENRIQDLWSILDFTCEGLLGEQIWFEANFEEDSHAINELKATIKPILLRRRVREVAKDLPDLTVKPVILEMPNRLYDEYRSLSLTPAADKREAAGRFMRKRKTCNHILDSQAEFIPDEDDGKMQYLRDSFETMSGSGLKGLVFVPFTSALIGLESWFKYSFKEIFVDHINGATPIAERQSVIDKFSKFEGGGVLLLNPKAGGVGLNITAANHVFHFSPDWNPAVMDQASARSFRRGQGLPVTIHNMCYSGTVEEDMYQRLDEKRNLSEDALEGSGRMPTLEELNIALARMPKDRR